MRHHQLPSFLGLLVVGVTSAAYLSPQVEDLAALRAESSVPVRIEFRSGFPVSVDFDVARPGGPAPDFVAVARQFLDDYANLYLQDHADVELLHARTDATPNGRRVVRFGQEWKSLPVFGAELLVTLHESAGQVHITRTAGALLSPARIDQAPAVELQVDLEPAITVETAEEVARREVGIVLASLAGTARLVIFDPSVLGESGDVRLAWRLSLGRTVQVLVDAHDATVVHTHGLTPNGDGLDDLDLQIDDAFGDVDEGCFEVDYDPQTIGDEDGLDPAWTIDPDAVKVFDSARATYLVYHDVFGRHSWDDDDEQIEIFIHTKFKDENGMLYTNAAANDGGCLKFSTAWAGLDTLAHEFTHQVNNHTADLIYMKQSGALDEAFSDILAMAVDPADWLLAEDRVGFLKPIRNLADPTDPWGDGKPNSSFEVKQPDRMSAYKYTLEDKGGVHTNSGIINKAFYLMSQGGPFNGRSVTAIGFPAMESLAYNTLTRLNSTAQFKDARNQAVAVAAEWAASGDYFFTASTVCSVRNAFRAVEIGQGDADCDGIEDHADDLDKDGFPDGDDNCPGAANPTQWDSDYDGTGDECDPDGDGDGVPNWKDPCFDVFNDFDDSDGDGTLDCYEVDDDDDGVPDDGDGSGKPWDNPCPDGVTVGCDDNCQDEPNPMQLDADDSGKGNVCDPDPDGDAFGVLTDNCTFVSNLGQADSDGDGFGDACDLCPNTPDTTYAYSASQFGWPPKPYQPDSDGDGTPDACDPTAWGDLGMLVSGAPVGLFNSVAADGVRREVLLEGQPGNGRSVRVPLGACASGAAPLVPGESVQLVFEGLSDAIAGRVEDDNGRIASRIRHSSVAPPLRGTRFRPRCDRQYSIVLTPGEAFDGAESFMALADRIMTEPGNNPWSSNAAMFMDAPDPLPDADGDGLWDANDTCPMTYDPGGADRDNDGRGDACDNCRTAFNPEQGMVEFDRVTAPDKSTFFWGEHFEYDFATGGSHEPWPGSPAPQVGAGVAYLDVFPDPAPGEFRWILFRHGGGCGTWGSAERDAAIPSTCERADLHCPPGSVCDAGRCTAAQALTVTRTGTGSGTVTSSPAGIDCGATCSAVYAHGTIVTLTAQPDAVSTFTGWGGACSGIASCSVTMDAATSVTASFSRATYALTVSKAGSGTGTVTSNPAGIACGADCTESYIHGTVVTLTAAPTDATHVFGGWSGACGGTGSCVVTMDAAKAVTATFTRVTHALTVSKAGAGTGTVTSSPTGINCGADCTQNYVHGTVVTLTAAPTDATHVFAGWSGACSGTGSCVVTMDAAKNVTATFRRVTFVLTVTKSGTGSGIVTSSPAGIDCGTDCSESYVTGTVVTLTANGVGRSVFVGWSGACTGTGTCTVTMSTNRAVTANFRQI